MDPYPQDYTIRYPHDQQLTSNTQLSNTFVAVMFILVFIVIILAIINDIVKSINHTVNPIFFWSGMIHRTIR